MMHRRLYAADGSDRHLLYFTGAAVVGAALSRRPKTTQETLLDAARKSVRAPMIVKCKKLSSLLPSFDLEPKRVKRFRSPARRLYRSEKF